MKIPLPIDPMKKLALAYLIVAYRAVIQDMQQRLDDAHRIVDGYDDDMLQSRTLNDYRDAEYLVEMETRLTKRLHAIEEAYENV